jgi:hypothetical protein
MTAETINEYWTLIMFASCISAFLVVVVVGGFVRVLSDMHERAHAPNVPEGKEIPPYRGVYVRPSPAPPVPDASEQGWAHNNGYYPGMLADFEANLPQQYRTKKK